MPGRCGAAQPTLIGITSTITPTTAPTSGTTDHPRLHAAPRQATSGLLGPGRRLDVPGPFSACGDRLRADGRCGGPDPPGPTRRERASRWLTAQAENVSTRA